MGRVIVKQPNGLWAVFSTVADDFIYVDLPDLESYIQEERKDAADATEKNIRDMQAQIEKFGSFWMTYEDCMETVKMVHGAKKARELRKSMSAKRSLQNG